MNLSRIRRLLQLIGLLQSGRRQNVESLAQACEVSRRTVFRDLDALRTAGIPLVFDEDQQRYRIPAANFLPPTNFTAEEALALIVLCHELGDGSALPFFGPARSAALKLESTLPAGLRDQLRAACDAIEILPVPTNPLLGHESTYERLLEAASRRQCVRIHYESLTEWKEICTRLNPYRLLFSRRSWYVIGRSSLHRSTRTFNVGRIRKLEVLDDHFEIPQGFSIDRYLRNAWHLISGPDADVVIRFSKMVAQNVAEVAWHKTQQTTFNDDGTLDFRVKVSGLEEISWWILGYGDQAEVLSPVKLRRMIADRVVHMADIYRDESLPR